MTTAEQASENAPAAPAVGIPLDRRVGRRLGPEPAEVGAFYLVPCLYVPREFHGDRWVPVIGPKHRDLELGVSWEHWHIDWRFTGERMFVACSNRLSGKPHGSVISNDSSSGDWKPSLTGTPKLKRRKCRREMPEFPATPKQPWVAMEVAQRAHCDKLKDGHTCPHRGIDLRPFARPDGTVICPGHGLRWDLRTGMLLAWHKPPNGALSGAPGTPGDSAATARHARAFRVFMTYESDGVSTVQPNVGGEAHAPRTTL